MSPYLRLRVPGGSLDALVEPGLSHEARLERLAAEWFKVDLSATRGERAGDTVPPLLRRLWDAGAESSMLRFQDELLAEDRMEVAPDGSAIFYAENQWCWAAILRPGAGPNPEVYLVEVFLSFEESPIFPSGMLLDEFLLRAALLETTIAAPVFGSLRRGTDDQVVAQVLEEFTPVINELEIGQFRGDAYWTDGRLLVSGLGSRLQVGARSHEDITASPLRRIPTDSWIFADR